MKTPCYNAVINKIFRQPLPTQSRILDKDTVDEIIFRTISSRNRIKLELMARAGMRISEVLNLTPADIDERKLILHIPINPHPCALGQRTMKQMKKTKND